MDWRYSLFTAEEGLLGIIPLSVALALLLLAASPGRRVVAASPCTELAMNFQVIGVGELGRPFMFICAVTPLAPMPDQSE